MPYECLLKHRVSAPGSSYLVTFCCFGRRRLLGAAQHATVVADALRDIESGDCCINLAWVLMPDHLHWLLTLRATQPLAQVVAAVKARSSRTIRRLDGGLSRIWQRGFHEHRMRHDEDLRRTARYLVANPLRAGLVSDISLYPWWFARWAKAPHGPLADGASGSDLMWV